MPKATNPSKRKNIKRRKKNNVFLKIFSALLSIIVKFKVAMSIITILLIILFYATGSYDKSKQFIAKKYRKICAESGLVLKDIILYGNKNASEQDILGVLSSLYSSEDYSQQVGNSLRDDSGQDKEELTIKGYPILNIDLVKIQKKLTAMQWIESATIERLLPSTLSVTVVERKPVALWQNKGRIRLIDAEGEIINVSSLENFVDLIIIIGDEAQSYAGIIFKIINTKPELAKRVSSLNFVSKRRWNVEMFNGMRVKLPEQNADKAWQYLAQMQEESAILDSGVSVLDLRIEDKLYIQ